MITQIQHLDEGKLIHIQSKFLRKISHILETWGKSEWKGDWSENSNLWTNELRKKLKAKDEKGTFWMSFDDFYENFYFLYLCKLLEEEYPKFVITRGEWTQKCCGGWRSFNNPKIKLEIEQSTRCLIRLHRIDNPNPIKDGIQLLICSDAIQKEQFIDENHIIAESEYKAADSVSFQVCLDPSKPPYWLVPCLQRKNTKARFIITIHCDHIPNLQGAEICGLQPFYKPSKSPSLPPVPIEKPLDASELKQPKILLVKGKHYM